MSIVEIIGGTVSGSLQFTSGDACRRIPKSTQVRESRRNAHKVNCLSADQIAAWPIGHLGDAFAAMNLETGNESSSVDLDRSPGGDRHHGGARRAGASSIAGSK
jgi:hypothetical protein